MRIQPDEGISLRFGAKVPGPDSTSAPVNMDFRYGSAFGVDPPDAYERCSSTRCSATPRCSPARDEVEAAWGIVTPILEAWAEGPPPDFPNYEAGTWGPAAADALIEQDGRRWRRI